MTTPEYLDGFIKSTAEERDGLVSIEICSSEGCEEFEIWYYGELLDIGEELEYITGSSLPELIYAKDIRSGEMILLFDGSKHGYDPMFCEKHDIEETESRELVRYSHPLSGIRLDVNYSIDYDDEKDDYEFNADGNVPIGDGSAVSWDTVKRNGFDWLTIHFIDENGAEHTFYDRELA